MDAEGARHGTGRSSSFLSQSLTTGTQSSREGPSPSGGFSAPAAGTQTRVPHAFSSSFGQVSSSRGSGGGFGTGPGGMVNKRHSSAGTHGGSPKGTPPHSRSSSLGSAVAGSGQVYGQGVGATGSTTGPGPATGFIGRNAGHSQWHTGAVTGVTTSPSQAQAQAVQVSPWAPNSSSPGADSATTGDRDGPRTP